MKILILNSILYTAQNNVIPQMDSIKDCMIYNLGLAFKSSGHDVTLVAASEYKPSKEEKYEIDVVFLPSVIKSVFLPGVLPFQPDLWGFLRNNKRNFDLIISSEIFSFPTLFASIHASRKVIVWHELAVHNRKMKGIPSFFWYNVIARLFFRKTLVVARSESARNFISRYVSRVSDTIIEHGVNLDKFSFSRAKKHQFIIVSQLISRKNIESILNKFSCFIAQHKYSDFRLMIVGRGELEDVLKRQTKELGIENNVKFVGFMPHSELNSLVTESMALLIDTKQDNNMVSIPESIVSGTPVLTNLVPTNAPMINKYQLGIAKTDWTENDLQEITENNDVYVENCIAIREQLSAKHSAKQFIDVFIESAK